MLESAAYACAFLFSVTGFVSIAASHIFLGLAIVLLLASRIPLRFPPIMAPVGAFFVWTLVSAAASHDLVGALPQIKKFYVFLALPVIYSVFRSVDAARRLLEAWVIVGVIVISYSIAQFAAKIAAAVLIGAGLALSFTRSVWLAMGLVAVYFVWEWRPKLLWLAPAAVALVAIAAPAPMLQRIESIRHPGPREPRPIMWRTGLRMIEAEPLTGVGPMHVGARFKEFLPEDVKVLPPAYYEHLHNVYIHYAAERGLPALAAVLWLLGKIVWDLRRGMGRLALGRSEERFLAQAGFAATLAVLAVSCFDVTLGDSEVLGAYLTIVALGYVGIRPSPSADA
jgi:O-antigen ligase